MFERKRTWARGGLLLLLFLLPAIHAWGQSVQPEDEYKKKIKVSQDIQPLGEKPFGENISLYNGALSFEQTDVDAEGNGPPIRIVRDFTIPSLSATHAPPQFYGKDHLYDGMSDWTLQIPHIETISAQQVDTDNKWYFLEQNDRCSNLHAAPDITTVPKNGGPIDYQPSQWWHGIQLIIPGKGSQGILKRDASNTITPSPMTVDGAAVSFPNTTKRHWAIGCLASTSNGQPGEAFLVVSPNGTKYWMDRMIYQDADTMTFPSFGGALFRRTVKMLVTKVEDRFGNTVTYSYDANNNLTSIVGSDGRKVVLSYETWDSGAAYRVHTVTLQPDDANPRTWVYE
jgi:YD repeat-containing protein